MEGGGGGVCVWGEGGCKYSSGASGPNIQGNYGMYKCKTGHSSS